MGTKRHAALMTVIVPDVVQLIAERWGLGEIDATRLFLESRTYAALEDEATDVWHFSPETIYLMFASEQETGRVSFPEEA